LKLLGIGQYSDLEAVDSGIFPFVSLPSPCATVNPLDTQQNDIDVIIGDLDSLKPEVKQFFSSQKQAPQIIYDPDQESTDFGKAINWIRNEQARITDIIAIGSLGGRVDQGLSQLHHLYLFQDTSRYQDGNIYLVTDQSLTFLLKSGKHHIQVRDDDGVDVFDKYVGVVPIKEPSVITTSGLEWDVTDWLTQFGGRMSTSNHVLPETRLVEVETTKDVLFTIALRREAGDSD
jgi:thiamine pyrophosphokinase